MSDLFTMPLKQNSGPSIFTTGQFGYMDLKKPNIYVVQFLENAF
jgi:hypothetical protein